MQNGRSEYYEILKQSRKVLEGDDNNHYRKELEKEC
jgi:hypothetical protein